MNEEGISTEQLQAQARLFLQRLHPFLKIFIPPEPDAEDDAVSIPAKVEARSILQKFLSQHLLYEGIPEFMHGIVCAFMVGHNESYIESVGSVLKHHNSQQRPISKEMVEAEQWIAWNGPEIQHCDEIVKATLNFMFGGEENYHFIRSSKGKIKPYVLSRAVDALQNTKSSIF